jgi:CheY-like chemotaxis protein
VTYRPEGLKSVELGELSRFLTEESRCLLDCPRCGSLQIDIVDQGPGMDESEMARLFREGVQFNPNQLQAGQGSGLGLWISKGILELHLGMLSAHSEGLGKGSTFSIEIPLLEASHSPSGSKDNNVSNVYISLSQSPEAVISPPSPVVPPIDTLQRILIVDDTATNRKIVHRILKRDGFTDVDEAKDGQECVEMVSCRPPSEPWYDLILMDYEMPRMNGPTATSRLRELGYSMPIIGVTGNILNADVTYFLESGANSVLPKPVVMKDLYEAYEKFKL